MARLDANENNMRIGLSFPLQLEERADGDEKKPRLLLGCSSEEHIKQSLRTLLLTGRGERVMRREFGNRLGAFLFENIDATTATLIKGEIRRAIEQYEPRVEIEEIKVLGHRRDPGVIGVELLYRISSTGVSQHFTMEIGR